MIRDFWTDESGAVIAAEYLLLGGVVVAGTAVGATRLADSLLDQYRAFGDNMRGTIDGYLGSGGTRGVGEPRRSLSLQQVTERP